MNLVFATLDDVSAVWTMSVPEVVDQVTTWSKFSEVCSARGPIPTCDDCRSRSVDFGDNPARGSTYYPVACTPQWTDFAPPLYFLITSCRTSLWSMLNRSMLVRDFIDYSLTKIMRYILHKLHKYLNVFSFVGRFGQLEVLSGKSRLTMSVPPARVLSTQQISDASTRKLGHWSAWVAGSLFPFPLPRPTRNFVICLFGVDALFIGYYSLVRALRFFGMDIEAGLFSITRDGGVPEVFNYLKLSLIVVVLSATYLRSRALLFLVTALCFGYVGLDDSLRIHEQLGNYLAEGLTLPVIAGLPSQALGELLVFASVGSVFTLAFVIAWLRTDAAQPRQFFACTFLLFALSFFAVFVDLLHALVGDVSRVVSKMLTIIEDGGELLIVSLSCWVLLSIFLHVSRQSTAGEILSHDRSSILAKK